MLKASVMCFLRIIRLLFRSPVNEADIVHEQDFITRFHNLKGDLRGERTKSFFKLLTTPNLFSNEKQLETALKNLEPTTYQQSIFYIDTLIYFERTNELLEILKGGNEVFISKILKQSWFFTSVFQEMDAKLLVNEFLPYMSLSLKKKILTKISKHWSKEKMDILFDALYEKYGLPVATPILHECTIAKIRFVIEENELKLRPHQVLHIYNRSEKFFITYLDHINKINNNRYEENKVISYVAKRNPELLLQLEEYEKVKISEPLGKRTTKIIVDRVKDVDFNNKHYFDFLNKPVLIRKLGTRFESVYKQLFPLKFSDIDIRFGNAALLKYYPKNRRFNLFIQVCSERFVNKSLDDILLSLYSLESLHPPKRIIKRWEELKYFEPSKLLAMIKERYSVRSNTLDLQSFIQHIITSSRNSRDLVALEELLKYVCLRHLNEDISFRNWVLMITKYSFKYEDFNETRWKYIDTIIKSLRIQNGLTYFIQIDFVEHYLEFLIKNGRDHRSTLIDYITDKINAKSLTTLHLRDMSLNRKIYIDICNILPVAVNPNSPKFRCHQTRFLKIILAFCAGNPQYSINITDFPHFVSLILQSFVKTEKFDCNDRQIISDIIYYNIKFPQYTVPHNENIFTKMSEIIKQENNIGDFSNIFNDLLPRKERGGIENEILKFYFEHVLKDYPEENIIRWFVKNEPKAVAPYISLIAKHNLNTYNLLDYDIVKHYSHLNFDKEICDLYKSKLDDERVTNQIYLIDGLRILLPTDDFLNLVNSRYLPKKDKLDLDDEEMRAIYNLQCEVAKILAKVNEPYKMLPTIMQFCKGDYLQSTLQSLYEAFYRSSESILYPCIAAMSKGAVSVRKHAVFLSCEVLNKEHTLKMLKNTDEYNVSTQKHLFSATLKYFLKNPSQDLFYTVMDGMNTIDINDTETFVRLKDITVLSKYRTAFFKKCWEFFEQLESKEVKVKEYLEKLLTDLNRELLKTLSVRFLTKIIKRHFPVLRDRLVGINTFIIQVLEVRVSNRSKYFKMVFDMVYEFPSKERKHFFQSFIDVARPDDADKRFVEVFNKNWNKYFDMVVTLDEHISLRLVLLKLKSGSFEEFGFNTAKYLETLIDEFGYHVYEHFKEQLRDTLCYLSYIEEYTFYLGILKYKVNTSTCAMVLDLLTDTDDESEELRDAYSKIIATLKNVDIPIVRIKYKDSVINKVFD